ncbi:hypothetical protein BRARA_B03998 [Brassica rapa]|uniref:BnaA02g34750D protein n=3 Tax=Brassica TaxID=3705 RepID=A0A078J099_BRANA|nr:uncharacterized protein LOC103855344 [Brassica rapa]XP_013722570.1 uncharacterized protein BNAA02G34750D [Brassica napus]KAH0849979.1 hypothetical protein HID58_095916 [Brassica napus]RID77055.1 hypothetical protein BRARA_B03998 [Brassica rapa]CAF2145528.1 unnamed protein product [Brassica napus]CAG7896315.1 unnamed protein product [Brassica rapa]CDY55087.1 BnaA02g34750D [Brassica napus]
MGACVSRECMRGDSAKLILLDGTLEEFSYPVKVWQILQKYPTSFVCNSDEMDFDDTVSAVSGNEELRLGQLYFVLPLTWLSHPLRAEEMATLAVKASSALTKSGGVSCADSIWEINYQSKKIARAKTNGGGGRGCGKGKRRFTANLSSIAE